MAAKRSEDSCLIYSFPPLSDERARVLILGTMPGIASLKAQQYYAHPRNLFWPIMGDLVGARPDLPYQERGKILKNSGIAVWDVFKSCLREGSLDTAIRQEEPHDFDEFFCTHRHIEKICFNGAIAEKAFRKHAPAVKIPGIRLPSTSPAHAARSYAEKLAAWKSILP